MQFLKISLTVILVSCSSYLLSATKITIDTKVVVEDKKNNQAPKEHAFISTVLLNKDYYHYIGEIERIIDFEKKIIYSINRKDKTYAKYPLHALVGFKDYEIENRKFLSEMLKQVEVSGPTMELVFSEHQLSVLANDSKIKLKKKKKDGGLAFYGEKKELLWLHGEILKSSKQTRNEFTRFFRNQYGGHPSVIDQLTTSSGIYSNINIWQRHMEEKQTSLSITSIKDEVDKKYSLEGLKEKVSYDSRLMKVIDLVGGNPIEKREQKEEEVLGSVKPLVQEKDMAGAILAYLEYSLINGAQNYPWSEEEKNELLNSEEVRRVLNASRNPESKEDAAALIKELEAIRERQKAGGHVLKIFQANTHTAIGDTKVAVELMYDALNVNPYITGLWKDLGDIYFRSYYPYEAWACWDTARKLNPSHPLLQSVSEFEKQLEKDHPGFF